MKDQAPQTILLVLFCFSNHVYLTTSFCPPINFASTTTSSLQLSPFERTSIWLRFSSVQEPFEATLDTESVKRDIEEMRNEAIRRLEALSVQMEQVKQDCETARERKKLEAQAEQQHLKSNMTVLLKDNSLALFNCTEGDQTRKSSQHDYDAANSKNARKNEAPVQNSPSVAAALTIASDRHCHDTMVDKKNRDNLLENTRWKIVFNIGREPGTWMPQPWGQSGDRLRMQIVVDFTDEPFYQREDFFLGFSTNSKKSVSDSLSVVGAKVLKVVESFVIPTGAGAMYKGRQSVQIKPTGAYKVMRGQGPMGTDIVRLFVDLEEEVHCGNVDKTKDGMASKGDVYCPAGRLYATCGYFPTNGNKGCDSKHSWKDILAEEQHAMMMRYEELQLEMEEDNRLFSFDQLKRMKELHEVKKELNEVSKRLQEARQKEPERSQLRMSVHGDVALSKEGGLCCKVHKGFAVEYHILGRLEVGCINQRKEDNDYENLVHMLHRNSSSS